MIHHSDTEVTQTCWLGNLWRLRHYKYSGNPDGECIS